MSMPMFPARNILTPAVFCSLQLTLWSSSSRCDSEHSALVMRVSCAGVAVDEGSTFAV
jgi:hypothetical protein